MTISKEYWNIPKSDDVLNIPQGTNLTVFVDHADNAWFWGIGASDVTAIASVVIAVIAASISIWQGCINRRHNQISVKPSLSFIKVVNNGEDVEGLNKSFSLSLVNNGLGVAKVTDFRIIINGNSIYGGGNNFLLDKSIDIRALITRNLFVSLDRNIENMKSMTLNVGGNISPQDKMMILSFDFKTSSEEEFSTMINKISYVIEYEDLYGKKMDTLIL